MSPGLLAELVSTLHSPPYSRWNLGGILRILAFQPGILQESTGIPVISELGDSPAISKIPGTWDFWRIPGGFLTELLFLSGLLPFLTNKSS